MQHWARGACEGTRAHTHAHTHQAARSRPPRPPPLRPSALPPVKTRRSALPSLRAPGREQALQVTSNLANEKLTSYRRGCNNGHTALRFCPFRPILQTVIQSGRGWGAGREGGEPHFIRPGEITMGRLPRPYCSLVAEPGLTSPFPAEPKLPVGTAEPRHPRPAARFGEGALPSSRAAVALSGPTPGAGDSAPRAARTQSGKGGRAGGAAGARGARRQPRSGAARESAGFRGAARATRSFLSSTTTTTLSVPRKATPDSSVLGGEGGVRGQSVHQPENNHNFEMYLQFPGKTKSR